MSKPSKKKPMAQRVAAAQARMGKISETEVQKTRGPGWSRARSDKPNEPELAGPRRRRAGEKPLGTSGDFHTVAESATASDYGRPRSYERDQRLIGTDRYRTFLNTILNSDVAAIAVRALLVLIAKVDWRMEPAKGVAAEEGDDSSEEATTWAAACHTILLEDLKTPWSMQARKLAMHIYFGFVWLEWMAEKREDGMVGFRDLYEVAQITVDGWDVNRNGEVFGVLQKAPQDMEMKYIARAKSIYMCDSPFAQGDPGGVGILRHVVKKVRQLEALEKLENDGYENDLRGIPVAYAPLGEMEDQKLSTEKKAEILQPLKDFTSGHNKNAGMGMILDSGVYRSEDEKGAPSGAKMVDVKILTGDGQGHAEIHNAIGRKNQEIARPMFAVGMALGDGAGNRALAEAHARFFAGFANSITADIADAANRDLIPVLGRLNDKPKDIWPKLVAEEITAEDVSVVADFLSKLALAGATLEPGDPAIDVARKRAKLPGVPQEMVDAAREAMEQERELAAEQGEAEVEATRIGAETTQMSTEAQMSQGERKLEIDAKAQAAAAKKPKPASGGGARKAPAKKRR